MNTILTKDRLETREERIKHLQLNNDYESMTSLKRYRSESEDEKISIKLHKRNHDHSFKEALSNNITDRTVCMICACFNYKIESPEVNIGKISNQHLLHPINEMSSCVIRLNIDIDSNTECVKMSEHVRNSLIQAKDSSVIINKMLLYGKTINLETGSGIICKKCYKYLISNKIPPFALNNSIWVGDVPQELQELTLSEQKLIALYRHSSCVIKLCSITRDPSLAHTALKGNVITFPQNVSEITKSLPLSSDELSQFIKIIFVGKSLPKKDQLRSILTVRREIIRKALIWLCKNNIFYKCIHIDHFLIDTLPINDIPDCLWNTLSLVDESKSQNVERSGYVTNYIDFNDLPENEIISLNTSALIDTDGGATSSIDIRQHLIRRINATNEVVASDDDNIYFLPHGRYPVNEYFNTGFLP
ncbi:unnamed protein product, partial [Rotaria magnacalcarata]